MRFCNLKHCRLSDEYSRDHCFYGYWEPQCWRRWLDACIRVIRLRFSK